ncbi:MAG: hypothetical protein A2X59_00160 [Nitrospirae bacterium GWC2_42_7]|nr:MAG: hypothetical protein A2X59_00160 [Nitrospirae bacterium GWC2_42_7]
MKKISWKIWVGLLLISLTIVLHFVHYLIFRDAHHVFIYMFGDIAFLPLEVLLVTFVIERLLHEREKKSLLNKMNMLIGSFYSEVGSRLIKNCSGFASDLSEISSHMLVSNKWSDKDFQNAKIFVLNSAPDIDSRKGDLESLRAFLENKRPFLLSLLANPNMLEHDAFTDLLWAVFHLDEEFSFRDNLKNLPPTDYQHLSGDMKRAYTQLLAEWLAYMKHLKSDYPYLFSLAARTNPLDANADPVVKE